MCYLEGKVGLHFLILFLLQLYYFLVWSADLLKVSEIQNSVMANERHSHISKTSESVIYTKALSLFFIYVACLCTGLQR